MLARLRPLAAVCLGAAAMPAAEPELDIAMHAQKEFVRLSAGDKRDPTLILSAVGLQDLSQLAHQKLQALERYAEDALAAKLYDAQKELNQTKSFFSATASEVEEQLRARTEALEQQWQQLAVASSHGQVGKCCCSSDDVCAWQNFKAGGDKDCLAGTQDYRDKVKPDAKGLVSSGSVDSLLRQCVSSPGWRVQSGGGTEPKPEEPVPEHPVPESTITSTPMIITDPLDGGADDETLVPTSPKPEPETSAPEQITSTPMIIADPPVGGAGDETLVPTSPNPEPETSAPEPITTSEKPETTSEEPEPTAETTSEKPEPTTTRFSTTPMLVPGLPVEEITTRTTDAPEVEPELPSPGAHVPESTLPPAADEPEDVDPAPTTSVDEPELTAPPAAIDEPETTAPPATVDELEPTSPPMAVDTEPPADAVVSEPVANSSCSDNPLFVDEFGQPCEKWVGLDCSKAVEEHSFTQDAEDDVIEMCPRSCGLCGQPVQPAPQAGEAEQQPCSCDEDDNIHVKITAVLTPMGTSRSANSLAQKRQREAGKKCDCASGRGSKP